MAEIITSPAIRSSGVTHDDFVLTAENLDAGVDLLRRLSEKQLQLLDIIYTEPEQPGMQVSLLGRLHDLEARLEVLERDRHEHHDAEKASTAMSAMAEAVGRIADAVAPRAEKLACHNAENEPQADLQASHPLVRDVKVPKCDRRATKKGRKSEVPEGLVLPNEVSTAEAATILGVSKDTVLTYREKGLLPFRNLAPPGSSKPIFVYPLEALIKMRTAYETEQQGAAPLQEPVRRLGKKTRQYKHLRIDDEP